jgi:hypothetical protein
MSAGQRGFLEPAQKKEEEEEEEEEADDGDRTRDPQLGKLMLYQLSYVRVTPS